MGATSVQRLSGLLRRVASRRCRRAVGLVALSAVAIGSARCTSCASETADVPRSVGRVELPLTTAEAQALCAAHPGKSLIVGTDEDDVLDGTNKDECIVAGGGNDRVSAGNGNDVVFAGDGVDEVYGNNGDDVLNLGAGDDRGYGGSGNDQLHGEAGSDVLDGENGNDVLLLGSGNDRGLGGNGDDELRGEDGADVLEGHNGNDSMFGDGCHDRIISSGGADIVVGGYGVDACIGAACELPSSTAPCSVDGNCAAGQRCVAASGVCVAAGEEICAVEHPGGGTCTPLGSTDTTCDGADDDCDGTFDENYSAQTLECGVGACTRTQLTSCVNGAVTGTCTPGTPAPSDPTCDSVDEDCDGVADESFASQVTHCGIGACATTGATSCVSGAVEDDCAPAPPAANDTICDRVDEDCNGLVDEDVPTQIIGCGVGACAAEGTRQCADGAFVDSCTPGSSTSVDSVCNGVDDDCDGPSDEEYVAAETNCGIGTCAAEGETSCVAGVVSNSCQPGLGAPSDATCNAADDDCDGSIDEDVTPLNVQCGVGACLRTGAVQCSAGQLQNSCTPGQAAEQDATCDGLDDDCDGSVDENYQSQLVSCGVGACAATGSTTCSAGQVTTSCTPGTGGAQDAVCNGLDDDCDNEVDEDFTTVPSSCGVGTCASTGGARVRGRCLHR
jgi:RTX calcium-binding nonapeptide repeat (4 copies)/Putative metal-binding motif